MTIKRAIAAVLLATTFGCTAFQTVPSSNLRASAPRGRIRVIEIDGTAYALDSARVVRDTLRGFQPDVLQDVAVSFDRVSEVQVQRHSTGRTVLFGAGVAVGMAALVVFINEATSGAGCGTRHPNELGMCPPVNQ